MTMKRVYLRRHLLFLAVALTGARAQDTPALQTQAQPQSAQTADRLATIPNTWERFGTMIDPHTADGLKVAREHLEPGVPMIVLETALPAKFAATIVEATGREPDRPASTQGIETLPRRFVDLPPTAQAVKRYILDHLVA